MRVDFYQLSRDPAHLVAPAIAAKCLAEGQRLVVVAGESAVLDRISDALWAASPSSFLAHGRASEEHPERQPILLGETCAAPNGARHVLLADGLWREEALRFERCFYLFDEGHIGPARENWRRLKAMPDVESRFWKQDGGRWVQAG